MKMLSLRSGPTQHVAPIKEQLYFSKESSTHDKKLIYAKGTASSTVHSWAPQERASTGYYSLSSIHHGFQYQVGIPVGVGFDRKLFDSYHGMHQTMSGVAVVAQVYRLTASANPLGPITSDESEEIVIVPLRELPHEYAKMEISEYVRLAGGRKVYISELAEKLRLDIELIMEIMEELETETR